MAKRGKWAIPLNQIPNDVVIHQYLFEKTDMKQMIARFDDYKYPDYVEVPVNFNLDALEKAVKEAIDVYGLHKFSYHGHEKDSISYNSSSLTYNPDAIDKISDNPHMATLGSTMLKYGSAEAYSKIPTSRNTYNDTFAFIERTPFGNHSEIKNFLDKFSRTLVRSRISVVCAGMEDTTKPNYGWHNDEFVFINLRVNIPIQTTTNYAIQIIPGEQSGEVLNIIEFELKRSKAYVYDTNKYHRPYCRKLDTVDRINMICGISPWFDFDQESKSWVSNEFYGEMHPFDMFREGHISSLVHS